MSDQIYYHGTHPLYIHDIATQGFRLGEYQHGRAHGAGLYIATKPETAGIWARESWADRKQYAVKCKLQKGSKIIWKDVDYDKKVIRYLEKEFGKGISRDYEFWKYIPHNKRLTNSELLALVSHLDYMSSCMSVAGDWFNSKSDRFESKKYRHLSRFSSLIQQYGYDALGDRTNKCWDSDDICVYNPSKVTLVSIHRIEVVWDRRQDRPQRVDYSYPLTMKEIRDISSKEKAAWQKQEDEWAAEEAERSEDERKD